MKKSLVKLLKVFVAGMLILILLFISFTVYLMRDISSNHYASEKIEQTEENIEERKIYNESYFDTPVSLDKEQCDTLLVQLQYEGDLFPYADYYRLEEALELYEKTVPGKKDDSTLLNEQGELDVNKLVAQVIKNNEEYMAGEKDSINIFYKEMEEKEINRICKVITEVTNARCYGIPIETVAARLMNLTMFEKSSSSSNAYISNNLTFVYNPNMIHNYSEMQKIQRGIDDEDLIWKSVIVHECMHLLQHSVEDNNSENGYEIGFCRMCNDPNEDEKRLLVDSLWYSWVIEASAELGMSKFLNIKPITYQKKISYVNSYNLSRFYEKIYALEDAVYKSTVEEVYDVLDYISKDEQMEFLKLMYSIEIIQSNPEEFWNSYGKKLSDGQMMEIRKEIRAGIVNFMSQEFYSNLVKAIKDEKISDYATLFYMIRLWEFDVYNHLEYTNVNYVESAKSAIQYQHKLQMLIFNALGDREMIMKEYQSYCIQIMNGDEVTMHCNLDDFDEETRSDIIRNMDGISTASFVRNEEMYANWDM